MEKMISVINDNLKSVISGIKTHREDTEKNLAQINNDISEKIAIAGRYKDQVDESKKVISNLETEIHDLEKDLKDLTEKFGSKNFTEILSAGNREINNKINEKKIEISEKSNNIVEITKKVKVLKDELIKLSDKKDATSKNLADSIVVENYFTSKLNQIINFSTEHPEELENYQETKIDEELNTMEVDETELKKQVDSSVFAEIDDISTDKIDDNLVDKALDHVDDEVVEEEHVEEPVEEEINETSMEEQLDDIISSANDLLNKTQEIREHASKIAKEAPVSAPVFEEIKEEVKPQSIVDVQPVLEPVEEEKIDFTEDDVDAEFQSILNDYKENAPEPSSEDFGKLNETEDNGIINLFIDEDQIPSSPVTSTPSKFIGDYAFSDEDDEKDDILSDATSQAIDLNELQAALNKIDQKAITNLEDQIRECGLEETMFDDFDVSKLKAHFDADNTKAFINVLNKHGLNKNVIYKAVDVLNEVTPQNLDIILTLIDKVNSSKETVETIFSHLNKININRLESSIRRDRNRELTEVLMEAMDYEGDIDLKQYFNVEIADIKKMQKASLGNDFKIINTFPELVSKNYNLLASFKINNLIECFTKYPHRFILDPDHFKAILDKYDTEDLVRCINKNAAVINRL